MNEAGRKLGSRIEPSKVNALFPLFPLLFPPLFPSIPGALTYENARCSRCSRLIHLYLHRQPPPPKTCARERGHDSSVRERFGSDFFTPPPHPGGWPSKQASMSSSSHAQWTSIDTSLVSRSHLEPILDAMVTAARKGTRLPLPLRGPAKRAPRRPWGSPFPRLFVRRAFHGRTALLHRHRCAACPGSLPKPASW